MMTNRLLQYGLIVCAFCFGCSDRQRIKINYGRAEGYFVRNDVPDGNQVQKIVNQEQFDGLLGMAATMTRRPTSIDFSKEFAVALILPMTEYSTEIRPDSIIREGDRLEVRYTIRSGIHQGFKIRPLLLLVVDRKYDGQIEAVERWETSEPGELMLEVREGRASATVSKKEMEKKTFVFEAAGGEKLEGVLTSGDSLANIRFIQIFMPDGSADGPFGREIGYELKQKGLYSLVVGEHMMAGDPWGGSLPSTSH